MHRAHLALSLALLAGAACLAAPEPVCIQHGATVEGFDCEETGHALGRALDVSEALGLETRLSGWLIQRAELEPSEQERAEGYGVIWGRSDPYTRTVLVTSLAPLCHEVQHVGRGVWSNSEHAGWFAANAVDAKCAEAMR